MPSIWCAISGHGYGHAAQVVPVLNALGTFVPGVTAILRTMVPASFFRDRLAIQWGYTPEADPAVLDRIVRAGNSQASEATISAI